MFEVTFLYTYRSYFISLLGIKCFNILPVKDMEYDINLFEETNKEKWMPDLSVEKMKTIYVNTTSIIYINKNFIE